MHLPIVFAVTLAVCFASAPMPHIVVITADDFGYANVGYHRTDDPTNEVQTPRIDALARSGVIVDRFYTYMYCSPSRSAFHSGRNPMHVNVWNDNLFVHNSSDSQYGFGGIPTSMTGLAEKLTGVGYAAHHIAKWHAGIGTHTHTPVGRGFNSSYGYLGAVNDYWDMSAWDQCPGHDVTQDLWYATRGVNSTDGPAFSALNNRTCSAAYENSSGCVHEEELFAAHVLNVIAAHDPSQPLFLNYAPHLVHEPLEAPKRYIEKFAFVPWPERQAYAAMTNMLDDIIGSIEDALKARGFWDNLLLIFFSDNGGPIYKGGGANNFPLRSGKVSNWEGGVRTNSFISGGFVPPGQRGSSLASVVAVEDWYATICGLAGVDPFDARAAAAGLPPIDSIDQWPVLSGMNATPPRPYAVLGVAITPGKDDKEFHYDIEAGRIFVAGIVTQQYKLLIGPQYQNVITGPLYPNRTTTYPDSLFDCGGLPLPEGGPGNGLGGCLYDLFADPSESKNIASLYPDIVRVLNETILRESARLIEYRHGPVDPAACAAAWNSTRKGVIGPWVTDSV